MLIFGKLVLGFIVALTYPPVVDGDPDTFVMDVVCFTETECEIQVVRGESHYARCEEDEPCWDCRTMGNMKCGPSATP